jgi:hypothetical protein
MGKSQKLLNRFAVGYRIAVRINAKAGDLDGSPRASEVCIGFSLRKPRCFAPGSFTYLGPDSTLTKPGGQVWVFQFRAKADQEEM